MIQFSGRDTYLLRNASFESTDARSRVVHPICQFVQRGVGVKEHIGTEDILAVGELVSLQLSKPIVELGVQILFEFVIVIPLFARTWICGANVGQLGTNRQIFYLMMRHLQATRQALLFQEGQKS